MRMKERTAGAFLSTPGLDKVLRWLGFCGSKEFLQEKIKEMDVDGDETLDFFEFLKLMRVLVDGMYSKTQRAWFFAAKRHPKTKETYLSYDVCSFYCQCFYFKYSEV